MKIDKGEESILKWEGVMTRQRTKGVERSSIIGGGTLKVYYREERERDDILSMSLNIV